MLRDSDGPNLREHLIATAARLIDERGSAGLAVRDIAREAQVADGVLYNYFQDKEDLLARAPPYATHACPRGSTGESRDSGRRMGRPRCRDAAPRLRQVPRRPARDL